MSQLEIENHPAVIDFKLRGIGGSLSGSSFSSIPGDLINEVFNGQTKRQAGPHRLGYRKIVDAVNTWVETTHIHAKMRQVLAQKIKLVANSVHKETTKGAKSLHNRHVKSLVSKLNDYGVDHF